MEADNPDNRVHPDGASRAGREAPGTGESQAAQRAQAQDSVAILMATCNGARYLPEQLDSIQAQSLGNWRLWASDDASEDNTLDVLADYRRQWGEDRMVVLEGERKGFPGNFMSLLCNPAIEADFVACSDQDDIWEADKLARAVTRLKSAPAGTPAVYFSRTRIVDEKGDEIGLSPLFRVSPCFRHALVQSIGGANTMVMNAAARQLLMQQGHERPVVSHDWWTYLVVSGCGGEVFYDTQPTVRYRQHPGNHVGANSTLSARATRFLWLLQGVFRRWNEQNIDALRDIRPQLTEENREVLNLFMQARQTGGLQGRRLLKAAGVFRASPWDRSFLQVAAMCRLL